MLENIPELDAREAKKPTLGELILQSLIDEPEKWTNIQLDYINHANGTKLYVSRDGYISLASSPMITIPREDRKKIYDQISKMRSADLEVLKESRLKEALARFGH